MNVKLVMTKSFKALSGIILSVIYCGSAQTTLAVELSDNGHGDVALFQYYSAKDDWQTFVRIINDSEDTTATKIRFREAANGRPVLDFVVFLGPYDQWVGWTDVNAVDGSPGIRTNDASCVTNVTTNPSPVSASFVTLNPAANLIAAKFNAFSFTDEYDDGGSVGDINVINRVSEGSIEVIGLASFSTSSPNQSVIRFIDYISTDNLTGKPSDCQSARTEFVTTISDSEEFLSYEEAFDFGNQMSANAYLINVSNGQGASYDPRMLKDFSNRSLIVQSVRTDTKPDLDSATTSSTWTNFSSNRVAQQGFLGQAGITGGVDAVSATLMSTNTSNEWASKKSSDPNSVFKNSFTQWVMSFPTKQFYVDLQSDPSIGDDISPTLADNSPGNDAVTPFTNEFARSRSSSCSPFIMHIRNNEGGGGFYQSPGLCFQTNVISFGNESAAKGLASSFSTVIPLSAIPLNASGTGPAKIGNAGITFTENNIAFTNNDGVIYHGIPVDGFMFQNYEATNQQSNYTTILSHKFYRETSP